MGALVGRFVNVPTPATFRMSGLPRRWPDVTAILGITVVVAAISQRWAGLDTPDSSFYTTLAVFGQSVTDRAIDPSYFWARLGQIAPTMAVTHLFGVWIGFAVYRLVLLLAIVASAHLLFRRFTSVGRAALLTAFIVTNTVVLSYLGNPYLTGSVLAGTSMLILLALSDRPPANIAAGFVLGWLLMVNPSGLIIAAIIWLTIRITRSRSTGAGRAGILLVISAAMAAATFAAFVLFGRIAFPSLDWFETYRVALRMTLSDFASKDPVWLHDVSLLVPLALVGTVTVAWATRRSSHIAQLGLTIAWSSIVGLAFVSWLMKGIALEAPFYQAMIWPPLLIALGLATLAVTENREWGWPTYAVGALGLVGIVIAGHWPGALTFSSGLALTALLAATALTGMIATEQSRGAVWAVIGIAILLIGAQLLQNSRGPIGLYYLSPYHWAYSSNPISEKLHAAVNTEQWVLEHTRSDDRMLVWVGGDWAGGDRQLYVVGGMQLWGPNLLTLNSQITDTDLPRLRDLKPTVLELIAPSMDEIVTLWSSIPSVNRASPPECYDFTWPVEPRVGHACLTRLSWVD